MPAGKTGKQWQCRQGKLTNKNCSIVHTTTKSCEKGGSRDADSSFLWQEAEECSFVVWTQMSMKQKQRRGDTNGFFFCLLVKSSCHKKEGAQKQRGHLVAQDASCSFSVPICWKKEGRENWLMQIVWSVSVTISQTSKKEKAVRRGSQDPDSSFLWQIG